MDVPQIRKAGEADRKTVYDAITLAFVADPFIRWMLPSPQAYMHYFPEICDAFGGASVDLGSCYLTTGGEGAALWLPPGVGPDEDRMNALLKAGVPAERQDTTEAVFEAMDAYHPEDDDCWYLAIIGVDAGQQGRGLGAALMKHVTGLLDAQGALGYLESSNPQNISLYERHGFEIIGEIRVGDAPVVTPMIRPRSA